MADITIAAAAVNFIIALIVSTIVIYIAAKLLREEEGFGTALLSALVGTVIYTLTYYFFGGGILTTLVGGIAWLIALGTLYKAGWRKALVMAIIVWVFAAVVNLALPTLVGPL